MKKIIITSLSLFVVFFATAQTTVLASQGATAKTTPTEDPHNPLVNGIPYSQYKAQQDALKSKQAIQQSTPAVLPAVTAINPQDLKNLRKEEKQPVTAATTVSSAKSVTAQNTGATTTGALVAPPVVNIKADTEPVQSATTTIPVLQAASAVIKN